MNRTLTYTLEENDCVGDALGKINFNFLNLDTKLCNLSSAFFGGDQSYYTIFNEISTKLLKLNEFADFFINPTEIISATTTTQLLSSFWNKFEFTVEYPLNLSKRNGSVITAQNKDIAEATAINISKTFLDKNYPASNYLTSTVANVALLVFNNLDTKVKTTRNGNFNKNNKLITVSQTKNDIYVSKVNKVTFIKTNNQWVFTKYEK